MKAQGGRRRKLEGEEGLSAQPPSQILPRTLGDFSLCPVVQKAGTLSCKEDWEVTLVGGGSTSPSPTPIPFPLGVLLGGDVGISQAVESPCPPWGRVESPCPPWGWDPVAVGAFVKGDHEIFKFASVENSAAPA